MSDIRQPPDFARVVLGDRPGKLAVAFGRRPYFDDTDSYRHREWTETLFDWPAEYGTALTAAIRQELSSGDPVDVYVCPAVRHGGAKSRRKGDALPPMVCWVDLDSQPADYMLWGSLNPLLVDSGQPQHVHAYVPLSKPIDLGRWRRLQEALRDRLGGDHKIADNDLLRMPGTLNHKRATRWVGHPPDHVRIGPVWPVVWDPDDLAELLGVDLARSNGTPGSSSANTVAGEPVSRTTLPAWLRERLNSETAPADRSAAFHGLVGACKVAELT